MKSAVSLWEIVLDCKSAPCFTSIYLDNMLFSAHTHPSLNPGQKVFEKVPK